MNAAKRSKVVHERREPPRSSSFAPSAAAGQCARALEWAGVRGGPCLPTLVDFPAPAGYESIRGAPMASQNTVPNIEQRATNATQQHIRRAHAAAHRPGDDVHVLRVTHAEDEATGNRRTGNIASVQAYFIAEQASFCEDVPSAQTPVTPPLGKVCSRGCTCAGTSSGNERPKSTYDCSAWNAPEWKRLNFSGSYSRDGKVWPTVYFHHEASWERTEQGCRLDFTVYGDLDEDGVFSTYTSTIEVGANGAIGNRPDDAVLLK